MDDHSKNAQARGGKSSAAARPASISEPAPAVASVAAPILPGPLAPAAESPIAQIKARIAELVAHKSEADAMRVEALAEIYRLDKQIVNAEAELTALSPPLTEVEQHRRFNAQLQIDAARRAEVMSRTERMHSPSPLDLALAARSHRGKMVIR